MTETKYIFLKQLQSVAALLFIAVLIVLLLILSIDNASWHTAMRSERLMTTRNFDNKQ